MNRLPAKLPFAIDREILIRAPRALVFSYFTDSRRFASWWGEGSTIDGRAGGAVQIMMPGNTVAVGEVLEIRAPERIVFTFGYQGEGKPIAPGASRVTITLTEQSEGTRLRLRHELADAAARDHHVQGWRYQLAVFANVAANEAHASVGVFVTRWFAAWNENDAAKRAATFAELVHDDLVFRDAYSCVRGLDDLLAHIAAAKVHMPGITIAPVGCPRHCQGTVLADWTATLPDGKPLGQGSNVFELAPDGRLTTVVGLWSQG
jgi:uncharacterized protein YndB with AHSA1/START domain